MSNILMAKLMECVTAYLAYDKQGSGQEVGVTIGLYQDIMRLLKTRGLFINIISKKGSGVIMKKSMSLLLIAIFFVVTNNAFAAVVATAPDLQAGAAELSATDGLAPTPLSMEEEAQLLSMEANQDVNLEEITAGSTVIDLILVVLLIYLILKLL